MEEHSALGVTTSELIVFLSPCAIFLAVAIASYRRCRCLSGYPIWQSSIIALCAGWFWFGWVILSLIDHKQLAQDWRDYRASRSGARLELAGR